jgi:hypothetical protein
MRYSTSDHAPIAPTHVHHSGQQPDTAPVTQHTGLTTPTYYHTTIRNTKPNYTRHQSQTYPLRSETYPFIHSRPFAPDLPCTHLHRAPVGLRCCHVPITALDNRFLYEQATSAHPNHFTLAPKAAPRHARGRAHTRRRITRQLEPGQGLGYEGSKATLLPSFPLGF